MRRRKSLVLPAALLAAGVAILVLNHVYGASMTNNLRSSAVFIGGSLALAGMITLAARFFSAEGAPYYRAGRSYLRYDELYFERSQSRDVVALVAEGNVERLLAMPHARVRRSPWPCTVRPTTASPPCRPSSTRTWNTGR